MHIVWGKQKIHTFWFEILKGKTSQNILKNSKVCNMEINCRSVNAHKVLNLQVA